MKTTKFIALLLAILALTATFTACGKKSAPVTYSEGLEFTLDGDGAGYAVSGIGACKDTKVNIPSTYEGLPVTGVSSGAFKGCGNLTSVTIPEGVTYIGSSAFEECEGLKSVTIPKSVTEILKYAFCGCTSLTSLTVPDRVTRIDQYAFSACTSLENLTIPASVTHIGDGVFYRCSSLKRLPFGGTVAQWEEAAVHNGVAAEFNCQVVCTDGTVDVVCP